MSKIKIASNPYEKHISYARWDETTGGWAEITFASNPNSRLISTELTEGFFPFIAQKIVDVIIEEYQDGKGAITLVFEGTEDEYEDLLPICASPNYADKVSCERGERYLENARKVLPDIIEVFGKVRPLIASSVFHREKLNTELQKIVDTTADTIPILVVGNYSAGKSTFINALIGSELLPSSDEPMTAKVYKIRREMDPHKASVRFWYGGDRIQVQFTDTESNITEGLSDKYLVKELHDELQKCNGEDLTSRVCKGISILNGADVDDDPEDPDDLIEISFPFRGEVWDQSSREFVIFDTPGSNSASNDKHLKVLKEALHGMSNGLPVYVSEYSSLDSIDNQRLIDEIKGMREIDSRFTMIVVNKADTAKLPSRDFTADEVNGVLSLTIPKSLYSEGIFFVSSIMGLGAKRDGHFIDEHYGEIYEDQKRKYSDETYKYYRRLYRYNIMPGQLKKRADEEAAKCGNLILANSGLFSVENEIQTFANKYSPYNKCQQSQLFLGKVIQITQTEIQNTRTSSEQARRKMQEQFDQGKQALIDSLKTRKEELVADYTDDYQKDLIPVVGKEGDKGYSVETLRAEEAVLTDKYADSMDYQTRQTKAKESIGSIGSNLKANLRNLLSAKDKESLKDTGSDFVSDFKESVRAQSELYKTRRAVNQNTSDELLKKINTVFREQMQESAGIINNASRQFWEAHTEELKNELGLVVTDSTALTEDKKEEIENIITTFQSIEFTDLPEDIFVKSDFEFGLKLGRLVIGDVDKLDLDKLSSRYSDKAHEAAQYMFQIIGHSHSTSFSTWAQNLLDTVVENIVEFNPLLASQAKAIEEETNKIKDLQTRQEALQDYTRQIQAMIGWKLTANES